MNAGKSNEFYIGWQNGYPSGTRRFLLFILAILIVSISAITYLVVANQKPFNDHQFEFGNVREFSGVLVYNPAPILLANGGLPENISREIVLVGYGKWGAKGILSEIEKVHGDLTQRRITVRGTLIRGDGKALLELTEKEKSLTEVSEQEARYERQISDPESVELQGEILDPKCYFGVMKPGEGKIHKSCAVRCISGGIPPVFRAEESSDSKLYEYYLMKDMQAQDINEAILPYVAERIQVSGQAQKVGDWNVLYLDINDINRLK